MRYISLFSGIGGFDLGFDRAGMECAAQVEIDDFCLKVLTKHWPNVPKFKDVRNVGKHNLPAADVIVGGFPCQPHSLAGKRQASADDRDLWGEYARIIGEIKPRWVVAENVPGLLTSEHGRFFGGVLKDLASNGYDVEWNSLPAAAFGAPHIRERVILIANNQGKGERGLPIRSWRSQQKGSYPDWLGQDISNLDGARLPQFSRQQLGGVQEQTKPFAGSSFSGGVTATEWRGWWATEPNVGRMVYGIPNRVDRIRGLGNAVVPQVAEWIGRRIMEAE